MLLRVFTVIFVLSHLVLAQEEHLKHSSPPGDAITPCPDIGCKNGGTCDVQSDTLKCLCTPGFTGPSCELKETPEQSNATVTKTTVPKLVTTTATVSESGANDDPSGEHTETDAQQPVCDPSSLLVRDQCSGHGSCVNTNKTGISCVCHVNFSGQTCEIDELCAGTRCNEHGKCADGKCTCDVDHYGPECELDACPGGCGNDGMCIKTKPTKPMEPPSCYCQPGFVGPNCERDLCKECKGKNQKCTDDFQCEEPATTTVEAPHVCTRSPCKNGGTCEEGGDGTPYTCKCTSEYTGTNCEETPPPAAVDVCTPSPCKNEGTCEKGGDGTTYKCKCTSEYTGTNCEETPPVTTEPTSTDVVTEEAPAAVDVCTPSPCKNEGTCGKGGDGTTYTCTCTSEYTGTNCEAKQIPDVHPQTADEKETALKEEESSTSHFLVFFLVASVLCIVGYIIFHNRKRLMGVVLEGPGGRGRSGRRPNNRDYAKLEENVSESMLKGGGKTYAY